MQPGIYRFRDKDDPVIKEMVVFVGYVRLLSHPLGALEPNTPSSKLHVTNTGLPLYRKCLEPNKWRGEWQGPLSIAEVLELGQVEPELAPYEEMLLSARIHRLFADDEVQGDDFESMGSM